MFPFSIAFVLVLLSGSEAVLPNVGSCTFMEYFCDALKCNTAFVKGLQKDPKGDCSAKFNKMIRCVTKTIQICAGDTLSQYQIDRIVRQSFKENVLCLEGGVEVPTMPTVGSPCSDTFSSDASACMRTFYQKFAANKSDPALCPESAKAKRCVKNLIASDCTFPSSVKEVLDLGFSDYNPYCANNRDPGATGNDQCYGVKELNNPLTSGTSTKHTNKHLTSSTTQKPKSQPAKVTSTGVKVKSSALQALSFPFLLMLFANKV